MGRPPTLSNTVEESIVKQALDAADKGFGLSRAMLRAKTGRLVKTTKLTTRFTNGIPGNTWWRGLKCRHPELVIRRPEKLSTARSRMMNRPVVENYFRELSKIIKDLHLETSPQHIWNADEKGFQMEHSPVAVCARKGSKSLPGRTATSRESISTLACVNADGQKMPPLCVVKGKTKRSLDAFNTQDAPEGTFWTWQERAWMTDVLGDHWFRDVFLPNCGPRRPQLLIMDSHSSHEVLGLLQLAKANDIHILALPPHTTAWLQPLDRCVFGPLSAAYNKSCAKFLSSSASNTITKKTWPALFKEAWNEALSDNNIRSGFRACGIFPLNQDAVPAAAFKTSEPFDVMPRTATSVESPQIEPEVPVLSADTLPNPSTIPCYTVATTSVSDTEFNDPHEISASTAEVLAQLLLPVTINIPATEFEIIDPNSFDGSDIQSQIENIFSPVKTSSGKSANKKKKSVTSHRLLTSDEIISEKERDMAMKVEKERQKEERKKKREEMAQRKKECKQKKKGVKKSKKVRCCVCMLEYDESQDENVHWVKCDKCEIWVHHLCIPIRMKESLNVGDFFCPKCQWLTD